MKHLRLYEEFGKITQYRIYFELEHLQMPLTDYFSYEADGSIDLKRAIKLGKQYMSKHHFGKYVPQKYIKYWKTVELDGDYNEIKTIDEV